MDVPPMVFEELERKKTDKKTSAQKSTLSSSIRDIKLACFDIL